MHYKAEGVDLSWESYRAGIFDFATTDVDEFVLNFNLDVMLRFGHLAVRFISRVPSSKLTKEYEHSQERVPVKHQYV